ncbi:hypothetical protein conserved [Leishmania donovani]|nr:hypothetical protein CGC20_13900 [Leishmania donovani]TPP54188.1 hypothetical protein CGC21_21735 [Leishmania donovani]CAJ1990178.1 hypothetical protein conserved [Leishmania donovani]
MATCLGVTMRAVISALLLCGLVAEVTFADPVRSTEYAGRVAAVTCCERVETAWPILRSWSRTCANERARGYATVKRFATMLAAYSRSSAPALTLSQVCRGKYLSREAVQAFFEHAFCGALPITHTDLVHSAYSPLMEDAPHDEDALASDVAVECQRLQQRWTMQAEQWEELLGGRHDLADAQYGLCPRSCTWVKDMLAGDAYDL